MDPAQKKQRQQLIIVLALLPVLGFFMLRNLGLLKSQGGEAIQPVISQIEDAAAPVTEGIKALQGRTMGAFEIAQEEARKATELPEDHERYLAEELRDPFISLLPRKQEPDTLRSSISNQTADGEIQTTFQRADGTMITMPEMSIQGLIWGGNSPQAIIDDTLYQVGDTVKGGKILAIKKTGLTFEYQGIKMSIPMPKEL